MTTLAQLDLTEGATIAQVRAIMSGIGIYGLDAQPEFFNLYGIGYPFFHTGISYFAGDTLRAGRFASGALIVASTFLMFIVLRRKTSSINSLVFCAFFYAACTYGQTPLDRPDALGLFVYVSGMALIEMSEPSAPSVLGVISISFLGFLVKPYFMVIGPLGISYIFLFRSYRMGIIYASIWLAAFCVLLLALNATMPFYITDVVAAQSVASDTTITVKSTEYMLRQVVAFLGFIAGPLWLGLVGLGARIVRRPRDQDRYHWRWTFAGYGFVVTGLILVTKLGYSTGNWLVYFFDLLLPFFMVWLAEQAPTLQDLPSPIAALVVVGIGASSAFTSYHGLWSPRVLGQIEMAWQQVAQDVQSHGKVLGSPAISALLVAEHRAVFDTGHTGYFPLSADPNALRLDGFTQPPGRVLNIWQTYCRNMRGMIANRAFDIIIRSSVDGHNNRQPDCFSGIPSTYRLSGRISFPVPWVNSLTVWLPKTP